MLWYSTFLPRRHGDCLAGKAQRGALMRVGTLLFKMGENGFQIGFEYSRGMDSLIAPEDVLKILSALRECGVVQLMLEFNSADSRDKHSGCKETTVKSDLEAILVSLAIPFERFKVSEVIKSDKAAGPFMLVSIRRLMVDEHEQPLHDSGGQK